MPYSDSNSRPPSPKPVPAPPPNSPRDGVTGVVRAFLGGGHSVEDTSMPCLSCLLYAGESVDTAAWQDNIAGISWR